MRIKTRTGNTIYDSSWTEGVDYDDEDEEDDEDYEYESDEDESLDDASTSDTEASMDMDQDEEREANDLMNEDQGVLHEEVHPETIEDEDEESVQEEDETETEVPEPPRRSGRARKAPTNLRPSMKGQSYDLHLNVSDEDAEEYDTCLLYTSPSPRDLSTSRMPSSA